MKENIKPVTPEDVAEQKKTVKKTPEAKKLEDENELSAKKQELKTNEDILYGFTDENGTPHPDIDEKIAMNKKYLEMKELEFRKDQIEPGNRRVMYEGDQRWRQLKKELFLTPELDKIKRSIERMEKQKVEMTKKNPELKKRINELEKKLGKDITKFEVKEDAK